MRETASSLARLLICATVVFAAVGCDTGPLAPSHNPAPVIAAIRSTGPLPGQPSGFADLGQTLTISATVLDAESSADSLEYEWSGPGAFEGGGATIRWRAPDRLPSTPATIALKLVVIERYRFGRLAEGNRVEKTLAVRVHNSQQEILDMGEDFLTLFSRSEISTEQVLHNFSPTCDGGRGRRDEAADTMNARLKYRQDFNRFRIARLPPVRFNFDGVCLAFGTRIRPADACSLFNVHWEFTYLVDEDTHKAGERGVTDGTDHVTAVLEDGDWKLCHSDFNGTGSSSLFSDTAE
jgi:hypothetical protein